MTSIHGKPLPRTCQFFATCCGKSSHAEAFLTRADRQCIKLPPNFPTALWLEICVKNGVRFAVAPASLLEVSPTDPSIDAIFQAYDGHDYDIDGCTCRVEVYGVHDDGCCKWVQLAIDGSAEKMITLRLCSTPQPGAGLISKITLH